MTALLGYQFALLARSQRWLAPGLLYVAVLAVGIQSGQPVLDSLGYGAAALLPVAAWLVRVCVTNEPPAARHCASAAVGPGRVHLAALLTAFGSTAVAGTIGTVVIVLISRRTSTSGSVEVPPLAAVAAGLLAVLACTLVGTTVGALCNRPLLRATGWAVALTALGALLALVTAGSPARSAVTGLVSGSDSGTVAFALLPSAAALLLAGAATAVTCALAARRG
ncbi:ABC transporter [Streptomyces sp. CA-294286]|uniref:ABC transporter n=1 Tax=Streptomyces sp. CA-294286 TaxID=3240070 RepID=UPI003D91DDBE